ncbi:MAG: hypothetical protein M1820_002042 [Bogoriella megaspora]|nr:MAG: hypothetical protein M1820_002042 [Bogoriella megaspora]
MDLGEKDLLFAINHIFLPPRLPREQEAEAIKKNDRLRKCTLKILTDFIKRNGKNQEIVPVMRPLAGMMKNWIAFQKGDELDVDRLDAALKKLRPTVVEAFEVSPSCKDVMSTEGRLSRDFPAAAVTIPRTTLAKKEFRKAFAHHIKKQNNEEIFYRAKAELGLQNAEHDPETPFMTIEVLMQVLLACGEPRKCTALRKHTRDDVLCTSRGKPWRRSPTWLLLRVGIQRYLQHIFPSDQGHSLYKSFLLFFMSLLGQRAVECGLPQDTLQVISAKLARRTSKIQGAASQIAAEEAIQTIEGIRHHREILWHEHQRQHTRTLPSLQGIIVTEADTDLELPGCFDFLQNTFQEDLDDRDAGAGIPDVNEESESTEEGLDPFKEDARVPPINRLCLQEEQLMKSVAQWSNSEHTEQQCAGFLRDMREYWGSALLEYEGMPRETSYAILIIAESFIAIDKYCVRKLEYLSKYSPGIPSDLLNPLLLPKREQLERLHAVERYLYSREAQARTQAQEHKGIILADPQKNSFAAERFKEESNLREKLTRIGGTALKKEEEKREIFNNKIKRKNQLLNDEEKLAHTHEEDFSAIYPYAKECEKCGLQEKAENMRIEAFYHYLPAAEAEAKAIVYELSAPFIFFWWREAAWFFLHDVGRREQVEGPKPQLFLQDYRPLKRSDQRKSNRRIVLASMDRERKPLLRLPSQFSDIVLDNKLLFRLYDIERKCWLLDQSAKVSVKTLCTFQLPEGPYRHLQWAVDNTDHGVKQIIAERYRRDPSIAQDEFDTFGKVRAGERMQWLSILKGIAFDTLPLDDENMAILVLQSGWESGTANATFGHLREAHRWFTDAHFCSELLLQLRNRINISEGSWKKHIGVSVVITILLRLLSLTSSPNIEKGTIDALLHVRTVVQKWYGKLVSLRCKSHDSQSPSDLGQLILRSALLCCSTFDVEARHRKQLLGNAEHLRSYMESLSLICAYKPDDWSSLPPELTAQLLSVSKTSHSLQSELSALTSTHGSGLSKAAQFHLQIAGIQSDWKVVRHGIGFIASSRTTGGPETNLVQFNLCSGELYVDGLQHGVVPDHFRIQSQFKRVFGNNPLPVIPNTSPEMLYKASKRFLTNQVHIGARKGKLVVRAKTDEDTFEILHQELFANDLPQHFVNGYSHWLNLSTKKIEFRPLHDLWQSSVKNWTLECSQSGSFRMRRGGVTLLRGSSPMHKAIVQCFESIEHQDYIHVQQIDSMTIEAVLPRYQLEFRRDDAGILQSTQLNAEVDPDQNIATLIGLKTTLALRERTLSDQHQQRHLLVPFGTIRIDNSGQYNSFSIDLGSTSSVRYTRFNVNDILRRLDEPADQASALFKNYLHALTSGDIADPFLGRTGTEEALTNLRASSVYYDTPPDPTVMSLLEQLSVLAPVRKRSTQIGQDVVWNEDLSQLAQHEGFYSAAQAIHQFASRSAAFYVSSNLGEPLIAGDQALHRRAEKRNAAFYGPDATTVRCTASDDCDYKPRDKPIAPEYPNNVYEIASLINAWPEKINIELNLMHAREITTKVAGFNSEFCRYRLEELLTLDISEEWGSLYRLCSQRGWEASRYELMFLFGPIVFGMVTEWEERAAMIRTFLSFAISGEFSGLNPPKDIPSYETLWGWPISETKLRAAIHISCPQPEYQPPSNVKKRSREKWMREHKAEAETYERELQEEEKKIYEALVQQWPATKLIIPSSLTLTKVDAGALLKNCRNLWDHWLDNDKLAKFLGQIEQRLGNIHCPNTVRYNAPSLEPTKVPQTSRDSDSHIVQGLKYVFSIVSPSSIDATVEPQLTVEHSNYPTSRSPEYYASLQKVVTFFKSSGCLAHRNFGKSLQGSLGALRNERIPHSNTEEVLAGMDFEANELSMRVQQNNLLSSIEEVLAEETPQFQALRAADLWPRLTVPSLVKFLVHSEFETLPEEWKFIILLVAESVILHQRSRRQRRLAVNGDTGRLIEEFENRPCRGWEPLEHPDWALLEIQNDFTIRKVQAEVALAMLNPVKGQNAVLQLDMGQGKSAVITPMLAAEIPKGGTIARIVVLRPLLKQTQKVLRRSLGQLPGRKIYHFPFSRSIRLDQQAIYSLRSTLEECQKENGLLIALPDEILSFRLMTRDMGNTDPNLASQLLAIDRWLGKNCRDVLDESDEILDPKFQLLYTVGTQRLVDGSPHRWLFHQALLSRAKFHLDGLKAKNQSSMEVVTNRSAFPTISFFAPKPAKDLQQSLAEDVVTGQVPGIDLNIFGDEIKRAVQEFIGQQSPSSGCQNIVRDAFPGENFNAVLILRGLLAKSVLVHVMQGKRWSVDYGLDARRGTNLAVPYQNKNKPTWSAEFSHADVAIGFTYISFYRAGLSIDQIQDCLRHSAAADEYPSWIESSEELAERYPRVESLNFDDDECCALLSKSLQFREDAINFYLQNLVFPREGCYFPKKLCASSWDLPAATLSHPTVGFSGTNDNKTLLPLSIQQRDMSRMKSTNAGMLQKLLQAENRQYVRLQDTSGSALGNAELISKLALEYPDIRVLIDVGAQILEMDNKEVARAWLQHAHDAKAAVFYDEHDEPLVIDRADMQEQLSLSSFQSNINQCLLYFDEAHTRGVDISIPHKVRAAVILGPKLIKDRLVQACMRMRRLGSDHSVTFFAHPQVDLSIRHSVGKDETAVLSTEDVLIWAGCNTCEVIEKARPLRLLQGLQHLRRQRFIIAFQDFSDRRKEEPVPQGRWERLWRDMQEEESQDLKRLYSPDHDPTAVFERLIDRKSNDAIMVELIKEYDNLRRNGIVYSNLDEEHEHEITREMQQELHYQIEKPFAVDASRHTVSSSLEEYINKGMLPSNDPLPYAFNQFKPSSAEKGLEIFKPEFSIIRATNDFLHTVKLPGNSPIDFYLSQPDWVLYSSVSGAEPVIISQHEANECMPAILCSPCVRLVPYGPRIRQSVVAPGRLRFYTRDPALPDPELEPSTVRDLNLFAGTLYIDSYHHFVQLCNYLGILADELPANSPQEIASYVSNVDRFVQPEGRKMLNWPGFCPFDKSPIPFLKKVLAIRHHGQDISSSHMGMLLDGKKVTRDRFERRSRGTTNSVTPARRRGQNESEASTSLPPGSPGARPKKRRRIKTEATTSEMGATGSSNLSGEDVEMQDDNENLGIFVKEEEMEG